MGIRQPGMERKERHLDGKADEEEHEHGDLEAWSVKPLTFQAFFQSFLGIAKSFLGLGNLGGIFAFSGLFQ